MPKLVFPGRKRECALNYRMLLAVVENMPSKPAYGGIIREIWKLGIPSINEVIIQSGKVSQAELDEIWAAGDAELRGRMLEADMFLQSLADAQARDVISHRDQKMLALLARGFASFAGENPDRRLSGRMRGQLFQAMEKYGNHVARRMLAEEGEENAHTLWSQCKKRASEDTEFDLAGMDEADLELLAWLPANIVRKAAESWFTVKNEAIKQRFLELMAAYPDPAIRLGLAENWRTPPDILKKLSNDGDAAIARIARDVSQGLPPYNYA